MTELLQLFADPDRMRARLHGNARQRNIGKLLLDGLRRGPETASVHNLTILVELAVMAPDIAKIDSVVISNLARLCGTSATRCCAGFFIGIVSPKDLLIPFIVTIPSGTAVQATSDSCDCYLRLGSSGIDQSTLPKAHQTSPAQSSTLSTADCPCPSALLQSPPTPSLKPHRTAR